jgi:hypothetical protein
MASQRKIEANRRNARQSTGPRSAQGKAMVNLNAVKHGLTATTVVLPHEDARAYQKRVETWTAERAPRGELGRYLAERVARISWQLDRAGAHEQARLARRIRTAAGGQVRDTILTSFGDTILISAVQMIDFDEVPGTPYSSRRSG